MKPIAWVRFADGPRPIYEDHEGQFTYDYLGEKIHGIWFIPRCEADLPIVVGPPMPDADRSSPTKTTNRT